jgi:hypothetical protein
MVWVVAWGLETGDAGHIARLSIPTMERPTPQEW